jgi:hypothetical protein
MKDISDKLIGGALICGGTVLTLVGGVAFCDITNYYQYGADLKTLADNAKVFTSHVVAATTAGCGIYGIRIGSEYFKK